MYLSYFAPYYVNFTVLIFYRDFLMSQSRKKSSTSESNSDSLLDHSDTSRTTSNKDQIKVSTNKSSRDRLIAVIIVVVIGMSGIVVLSQLNIFPNNSGPNLNVNSGPVDLVKTGEGNFYQDLNANALFINHKVSFVYVGGLFCPICAMERWAIVMALSQFGNFSSPSFIYSSEGNIATYNFMKMTYASSIVNFESVEHADQSNTLLEPLSGLSAQLYNKYNTGQYIPFICIGGSYIQIGAGPSLNTLVFSGLTYQQIQLQIQSSNGAVYNEILAESTIIVSFINQLLSQQSNV